MFNLYANSIDPNGFISLVSNNKEVSSEENRISNRKILSGFAVASLLIVSVTANGSQSQKIAEYQEFANLLLTHHPSKGIV